MAQGKAARVSERLRHDRGARRAPCREETQARSFSRLRARRYAPRIARATPWPQKRSSWYGAVSKSRTSASEARRRCARAIRGGGGRIGELLDEKQRAGRVDHDPARALVLKEAKNLMRRDENERDRVSIDHKRAGVGGALVRARVRVDARRAARGYRVAPRRVRRGRAPDPFGDRTSHREGPGRGKTAKARVGAAQRRVHAERRRAQRLREASGGEGTTDTVEARAHVVIIRM